MIRKHIRAIIERRAAALQAAEREQREELARRLQRQLNLQRQLDQAKAATRGRLDLKATDPWAQAWEGEARRLAARSPYPIAQKAADPPATDQQKTVAKLAAERHEAVDKQIEGFSTALENLAAKWQAEISQLLDFGQATVEAATRLQQLDYLRNEITQQLNRFGYQDLVNGFLANYDEAQTAAAESLHALGIKTPRLTPLDQSALLSLRNLDFVKLMRAGSDTVSAVSEGIIQNALGGMSRREMIKIIAGTLEKRFEHLAVTYADTGLVSYDRTVQYRLYTAAGIDTFKYAGPKDIKTREFCLEHVNKIYTRAEIDKMDNGVKQIPNVWLYGGGYNCRHTWLPWYEKPPASPAPAA